MDATQKPKIILGAGAETDVIVWQSALQISIRPMENLKVMNPSISIA
jgi:hypothetical protein